MSEIKISIDIKSNPMAFGWKDPKLIDLFLEESILLVEIL